ncbi:MAG: dihydrofolate reductase family protein [Ignavibacteriaceae bacterium]
MRILKLQMQMSINGFVGGPNGELDWMTWDWSEDIKRFVNHLHHSVDTILLGRKMTDGFINHWLSVVDEHDESTKQLKENYLFAKMMIDTPKVVFTKTLDNHTWINTTLAKGNIVDEVNRLKDLDGKEIIVYGGADFVSSLIKENLIDEYYLFVNPVVIKEGLTIFNKIPDMKKLILSGSNEFDCGINLLKYEKA